MRREHSRLSFEPEYRAVHIWLAPKNADVVGQIARSEIIRAVHDDVVSGYNLGGVFARETAVMQFDLDLRIDVAQPILRRFQFAAADVFCSVKNLTLQIGKVDVIEIDNTNCSNTGGCEIQRSR